MKNAGEGCVSATIRGLKVLCSEISVCLECRGELNLLYDEAEGVGKVRDGQELYLLDLCGARCESE
jgi:hypothetical protein